MSKRSAEEEDSKSTTTTKKIKIENKNKINEIIIKNFDEEILYKQHEVEKITERIFDAQNMLDKLRALVLCRYYSLNGNLQLNSFINHPALLEFKRETLEKYDLTLPKLLLDTKVELFNHQQHQGEEQQQQQHGYGGGEDSTIANFENQYKLKICVGNVSKYLNINKPQKEHSLNQASIYDDKLISHKWMIYVRSQNCKNIDSYIKKVVFHLHQSYKPNDVVELTKAPFQLTKRGWGEFPVHVQIHFKDSRNKRMDIVHQLKLDWTLTGLQTFGGESVKEADIVINNIDYMSDDIKSQKRKENLSAVATTDETKNESDSDHPKSTLKRVLTIDDLFAKDNEASNNPQHYQNHNHEDTQAYEDDDYESINPTTTLIGTSYINDLILDLTNHSFDLSNHETPAVQPQPSANLIDTFLTTPTTTEILKCDESSVSSSTSSSITQSPAMCKPPAPAPVPVPSSQNPIKSNIDDLLNLRLKAKPITSQPVKSSSLAVVVTQASKAKPLVSLSTSPSITSIKSIEIKPAIITKPSTPPHQPQQSITTVVKSPKLPTLSQVSLSPTIKSRPQITPVVKSVEACANVGAMFKTSSSLASSITTQASNNKKCVIYKVESKDINKTKVESNNKQQQQQPKQQQMAQQRFNPLLTDHNTCLQLSKAKTKNGLAKSSKHVDQKDIKPVIKSINAPTMISTTSVIAVPNTKHASLPSTNVASITKSSDVKIYSINDSMLNDVVKSVNRFDNYENYLKIAQKYSPIVSRNANRTHLPFCSSSLNHYFSLPYAKRRANEWMRALNVKQRVNSMISKSKQMSKITPWSTKRILIWLRAHGYTPLDHKIVKTKTDSVLNNANSNVTNGDNKTHKTDYDYISSLTPYDRLLNDEIVNIKANNQLNTNEVIDIVNNTDMRTDNGFDTKEFIDRKLKKSAEEFELNRNFDYLLEMSNGGKYVKEQLNMIDIKTNAVNLSANIGCKLVEEFIFSVAKRFSEDLIRDTCSNIYYESLDNSNNTKKLDKIKNYSSNSNSSSSTNNHYMTKINVIDVFNTICKNDKYDFLTNNYLANVNNNDENNRRTNNNENTAYDASQSKIK